MREQATTVFVYLSPLLVLGAGAFCAWAGKLIARYIKDARYATALQVLATGAAAIVADFAQNIVPALKDPNKPGAWDDVAKAELRATAVERLKRLYPQTVALVHESLQDPSQVNSLLGTLVERGVLASKTTPTPAPTE